MRVLVVKIGAVGDVIMALPIVTALRRDDPAVRITWLCGMASAPIVSLVDDVEVVTLDERRLYTGSTRARVSEVLKTWLRLFGRRFDLVVTGHSDRRYRMLSVTAVAGTRRAFERHRGRMWPVPGRYHADEYCRLVGNVDGPEATAVKNPTLNLSGCENVLSMFGESSKPTVALAPGGAKNSMTDSPLRRWPLAAYRQLGKQLLRRGFRVMITGSKSDDWVREGFRDLEVFDLVGKTSLAELLVVYRSCAAVVTHDSGPMHIAMLAEVPTVVLFGPTAPCEKVPATRRVRVMVGDADMACRPCYDGRTYADCADNRCMRDISVEAVMEAVESLLGDSATQAGPSQAGIASRGGRL